MKCEYCGTKIDASIKTCPNCGLENKNYKKDYIQGKSNNNSSNDIQDDIAYKSIGRGRRVTLTVTTILSVIFLVIGAGAIYYSTKLFPSMDTNDLTKLVLIFIIILFGIIGGGSSIISIVFSSIGISLASVSFKRKQKPIVRLVICILCLLGSIAAIVVFITGLFSI